MFADLKKIYRSWLRVGDRDVPAFAEEGGVKIDTESNLLHLTIRATLKAGELDAIALNQAFTIADRREQVTLVEVVPKSREATIAPKIKGKQWQIEAQDPSNPTAIAYYWQDNRGHEVAIADKISDSNQIVILEGGDLLVSNNLISKTLKIRLPIIYLRAVSILPSSLKDPIVARLLAQTNTGNVRLLTIPCQENRSSKFLDGAMRNLRFTFDPSAIVVDETRL